MMQRDSESLDQMAGVAYFVGIGVILALLIRYTAETEIGMRVWARLSEVVGLSTNVLTLGAAGLVLLGFVCIPPILLLSNSERGGSTLAEWGRIFMAFASICCLVYALVYLVS
ncbi:hypothetical protein [Comamonas testosteroni]|jgi:hypothetical protein|uniref:hypothetical protein n=1 Tax=Comamonas testosteroni TaxID=285 RepID=UPI0026EA2870|nr:hypothetical protein [Comamonas testosteroni]